MLRAIDVFLLISFATLTTITAVTPASRHAMLLPLGYHAAHASCARHVTAKRHARDAVERC